MAATILQPYLSKDGDHEDLDNNHGINDNSYDSSDDPEERKETE